MKIVVGINALSSGGAEVFASELAVAYAKMKNEVFLITYVGVINEKGNKLKSYLENNNVRVIDLSGKPKILILFYYIKVILNLKPQLIHSNLEQTDFFLIFTKFFNKRGKYIRTLHNIKAFERFPKWLHKFLFRNYLNIGCSKFTKTHFEIVECRDKIIPIDNGVDISRLPQKLDAELRKEEKTIFLVIGTSQKRFGLYQKGHDLIVEAFRDIIGSYEVLFLGEISNFEKDFPEIKNNINFKLVGVTSDINPYIAVSDFLLTPSRFEGLPISTIEGVCSGLPLICSNIDGFIPFMESNSSIIFESENVEDLKNKIQFSIYNKENLKKAAVENSYSYRKKFDIDEVAKNYINLV